MTHSTRTRSFVTSSLLALVATGCDLDPESVGDEDTGPGTAESTGDPGTTGIEDTMGTTAADGGSTDAPSETTTASTGDDGPGEGDGEVLHEWEGVFYHYLTRHPDGPLLAMGKHFAGDTLVSIFDSAGDESSLWGFGWSGFQAFAVTDAGNVVMGGGNSPVDAPMTMEAFLWLLDDEGSPTTTMIVAGGSSVVTHVAAGGGTLWTLTGEKAAGAPGPRLGVLRRHGPAAAVELEHPLLAPADGLAVDSEGSAYTITTEAALELHRVALDGSVAWSVPLEVEPTGRCVLDPRPAELGVVIVCAVEGGRHVQAVDGDGVTDGVFVVPAMESAWAPAADVGDAIVLAHPLPPDAYVVEARALDGAQLWSATRSVPGASELRVNDVLEIPGGAMVIGQAIRGGTEHGFARFIVAP